MKRIAFYGGSFDPVHEGHLTIARKLSEIFELDEFVFIPAFHAPHKKDKKPTSAFQRFAMLALATNDAPKIKVSKMEIEAPERPYTVETLTRLKNEMPEARIFFVMGADSWQDITTWREWEKVLTLTNIIVVTRPDYEIGFAHVTEEIRQRIDDSRIHITDAVQIDVSATEIRGKIRDGANGWQEFLPAEVIKYIEKYNLYLK
jgi:nicotinate-nucleotide adenylyltransferase